MSDAMRCIVKSMQNKALEFDFVLTDLHAELFARASLGDMRKPTPKMIEGANTHNDLWSELWKVVWQAAIDEALK